MSANNDGLPKDLDAIPYRQLSAQQLGARMARLLLEPEVAHELTFYARNERAALLSECRRRGWL